MKISTFTDLRFTACDTPTGVGKHITQMVLGLAAMPENEVSLLAAWDQVNKGGLRSSNSLSSLSAKRLPFPWKVSEAIWTLAGRPYADRYCEDADWVYCPKNDFIPLDQTRLAVTIHGAHELDPQMPQSRDLGSRLNRLRRRTSYSRIVERANLILTVSEFLKQQIVDWFDCDAVKIEVVGNGVEPDYFTAAKEPRGVSGRELSRPYLLCVGGLNDLDGAEQTLNTAAMLGQQLPDLGIFVAGAQNEPQYVARAHEIGNIKLLGYVPAARLASIMRDALALLFLPEYETFGIAAAEAMAAGTPIITSGKTAIPEVVGDAGLYVSGAGQECVDKVVGLLNDKDLAKSLSALGQLRARDFTWQACAQRLNGFLEKHH